MESYLLLYLKTGGGHLAPAKAVAKYFRENDSNTNIILADGLEESPQFVKKIIEDGYGLLQSKAKWYYEFLYATNKFLPIGFLNISLTNYFVSDYIKKLILEQKPSKIVIFHFFLIAPVYRILSELESYIPALTVVTDPYTAHPLWFQTKRQKYVIFSDKLLKECIKKKISSENLFLNPFIVDQKFSNTMDENQKKDFCISKNIHYDSKTILLLGGCDGLPRGEKVLVELLSNNSCNYQIIMVCGKNKELFEKGTELKKKYPQLIVFGYVDFVYELLNISDVVITKCGASTIMEILLLKKVPIIIDYIWEQEKGNMEFVRDNKMGIYEKRISLIPQIVNRLFTDKSYYASFIKNIESSNLKIGTASLSRTIKMLK